MNSTGTFDVCVLGAGVAGSSLACILARRGLRVVVVERQRYPAHRVCGEFLSPEAIPMLHRLGVLSDLRQLGAVTIERIRVSASDGSSWCDALPGTGLGLSRWTLDHALFERAGAAGANTIDRADVQEIERVDGGVRVGYRGDDGSHQLTARLVVGAFGKRSRLERTFGRVKPSGAAELVAFKGHYQGLDLGDVIELHAFPGGYCGLSMVEGGRVNLCLQVRAEELRAVGGTFDRLRCHRLCANPLLAERLSALEPLWSRPLSIAAYQSGIRPPQTDREWLRIGDATGKIAPLAGDGMAMALRSAELVAPLVQQQLAGQLDERAAATRYRELWQNEFGTRVRLGAWLDIVLMRPIWATLGVRALDRLPRLGKALMRATRGGLVEPGVV